jgi:hypothetical protein
MTKQPDYLSTTGNGCEYYKGLCNECTRVVCKYDEWAVYRDKAVELRDMGMSIESICTLLDRSRQVVSKYLNSRSNK